MGIVAFLQHGFLDEVKSIVLQHPRNGIKQTFLYNDSEVYELSKIDRPHSSFFIGDECISNGDVVVPLKVHPVFIMLPVISKRGKEMLSYNDFFKDTELYQLSSVLLKYLDCICDSLDMGDGLIYYYSEEKAMDWIIKKILLLMKSLSNKYNMDNKFLVEIAFDIVKHYLNKDFENKIKKKLKILYPDSFLEHKEEEVVDVPKETKKKKVMKSKNDGNLSITSFFKPIKAKK